MRVWASAVLVLLLSCGQTERPSNSAPSGSGGSAGLGASGGQGGTGCVPTEDYFTIGCACVGLPCEQGDGCYEPAHIQGPAVASCYCAPSGTMSCTLNGWWNQGGAGATGVGGAPADGGSAAGGNAGRGEAGEAGGTDGP
jgi:hypothetical protein